MPKKTPKRSDHTPPPQSGEPHYEATEPERIRELERRRPEPRDEDEFVTDAELEAREIDQASDET
jgi:hypothetical protein